MTLRIPERLFDAVIDHLDRTRPNEGCGLIAFDGDTPVRIYPGTNILQSPTRYRMDDAEVLEAVSDMEAHGWWLGAIFHSHPISPPVPSSTDVLEANWPDALMIIASFQHEDPEARAYQIHGQRYTEVAIDVVPDRLDWLAPLRRWSGLQAEPYSGPRPEWQPAVAGFATTTDTDFDPLIDAFEPHRRAVVGILGGMGPLATADLYQKIIELTPAERDQEHIPVVIYADPRVPDRTDALLHGGENPVPWLVRGARALDALGADFIVIPCNTAHAFLDDIQPHIEPPILSMIDAAADEIRETWPDAQVVGLLATSGTIASEMYQRALQQRGIDVIVSDDDVQERCVMTAIRSVKAGRAISDATALLVEASQHLTERGADVLLAACTEIPVALQQPDVETPLLDATLALARAAVDTALHLDGSAQWETSTTGWPLPGESEP
ncbi:MAG: amino acid racemase [Thermomicrobiales bacterium]|nr:amino acid racemase [Thermomicrobiales bacterium]